MQTLVLSLDHLAVIGEMLPHRLFELGPAPTALDARREGIVKRQLEQANIVVRGRLRAPAADALNTLAAYDEAYWGMLSLYNQRQPVVFDVDDRWLPHLQYSFSDVPKIYVLVARRGISVATAVRASNRVDISQRNLVGSFASFAAQSLLALGDPRGRWKPTSMPPTSFPISLLEHAPARRPLEQSEDEARLNEYSLEVTQFSQLARDYGVSPRSAAAIRDLLGYDHIAATAVTHSVGPQKRTAKGHASLDYFHRRGVSVSSMHVNVDGSLWRTVAPAALNTVVEALQGLGSLPSEPLNAKV
jgi:hypothetical protein